MLGSPIAGLADGDFFECSVSLSSNEMVVATGTCEKGYMQIYSYSSSKSSWNMLSSISGLEASNNFGSAVSLSSNRMIVAASASNSTDNSSDSGHTRIFSHQNSVLAREDGFCLDA